MKYDEKGQLQNTDWRIWFTPEFFYESEGRLRKFVTAHGFPGGPAYTYSFLKYDTKGHLSQKTSFPAGDHGLQDMYNVDFDVFMAEVSLETALNCYGMLLNMMEGKVQQVQPNGDT